MVTEERIDEVRKQVTRPMFCGNTDLYKELFQYIDQLNKESEAVFKALNLIQNDVYAISFQTIGQYRNALVKEITKMVSNNLINERAK